MALLADRVKETTTTTGTGTVSLAGAPAGFQSFNTAFANGSLVYYVIQGGAEFEIGIGTTGTGTLARTQVLQSSNADALVPFSAGVKDVFCSYVADRAVTTVDAATLTNKTIDDYTNDIGANSTHFRIKATGTISKGSVVKATGYNPGEQAIEVAVVTSATDLVLGISEQALTTGQFGLAVVIGELFDVNTNGFTVGNIIYSNGAGGFTETKPSSGLYQALGWIVRANASNGVIAVNVVAPLYVETATNTANTSVLRDGSGNFAAGTITATLSGTATQVSQALTAGSYLTSTGTYNGGTARTFAVDATDVNTASKVVARDASGNFAAGTITAALSGNATTATTADKVANALTAGSYITSTGTFDGSAARTFAVDATDANTASKVVARDASGNFSAGTITATLNGAAPAGSLSGTTLASGVTASSLTSVGTLSSLTVSGDLTVDTSTLKVDSANNRVGIGTASPNTTLAVQGTNAMTSFTGTAYSTVLIRDGDATNEYSGLDFSSSGDFPFARIAAQKTAGGSFLSFGTSNSYGSGITNTAMTIDPSGNLAVDTNTLYVDAANNRVGVGTASPSVALDATASGATVANFNRTTSNGKTVDVQLLGTSVGWLGSNGNGDFVQAASSGGLASTAFSWVLNTTEAMRLVSGNLGLGVTPSGNYTLQAQDNVSSGFKGFRLGGFRGGASGTGYPWVGYNIRPTSSSDAYNYDAGDVASAIRFADGIRFYTAPSGTAGNAITFTSAMTLEADADLGLNVSSVTAIGSNITTMQIRGRTVNDGGGIRFDTSDASHIGLAYIGNAGMDIGTSTNTPLRFFTGSGFNERARITSGGYTKASDAGTYVSSTGTYHEMRQSAADYTLYNSNTHASGPYGIYQRYTAASPNGTLNWFLICEDSTAIRANIRSNGGLANYQSNNVDLSDARTKTDITPAASMWSKIGALEIVTYKYTDQTHDDVNVGVIAQQVEAVEPVWVDADGMGETPADGVPLKTVYTKDITFAAIKALQEAMARIETLEQRVLALEA